MKNYFTSLAAVAAFVAFSAPAAATTTVVGAGSGGNCFPFGCALSGQTSTVYQQVYAASSFGTSPILLTGLGFKFASGTPNSGTYTLSLSTSRNPVNGLSTTFANNIGANNKQIYSGTLASLFNSSTGLLQFNFAAFNYNPLSGPLLLDIKVSGNAVRNTGALFADNGNSGGVYSRVSNFGTGTSNFGLQTIFTYTTPVSTPEPATWLTMIVGLGLTAASLRRRQRQLTAAA